MRRLPSREEVRSRSAASAVDERVLVGRADGHERAAPSGVARRDDVAAELVDARDQRLVELRHMRARRSMPISFISSMPAMPA